MIPTIPDGMTLVTELPANDKVPSHYTLLAEYHDGTNIFVSKLSFSQEEVQQNLVWHNGRILMRVLIGRLAHTLQKQEIDEFYRELHRWSCSND